MKLGTLQNPKFLRLARSLGCGKAAAAGHLEALWHFASAQAPAGNVGRWHDEDIAEGCFWEGDPAEFVAALVASGWLDECPLHRLIVHQWGEHASEMIKKRNQRAGIEFAEVQTDEPEETNENQAEDEPTAPASNGAERQTTADSVRRTADHQTPPHPTSPDPTSGLAAARQAGREPPWDWLIPILRSKHQAKSTDAELCEFLRFRYDELEARIGAEHPGEETNWPALKAHAISAWNVYLRTRDPNDRQYAREVKLRATVAARESLDAVPSEPVSGEEPALFDPLSFAPGGDARGVN